eukprot:3835902-Rhodomonas_salina.1
MGNDEDWESGRHASNLKHPRRGAHSLPGVDVPGASGLRPLRHSRNQSLFSTVMPRDAQSALRCEPRTEVEPVVRVSRRRRTS